jgi:phosphatidylglycerol lysyltransferase
MGIINGLAVLLPYRSFLLDLIEQIAPFSPLIWPFMGTSRTVALILGFFLCLIAIGLAHGKRSAWHFAVILLPLSALAHLIKGLDIEEAALDMVIWAALLASKHFFSVASDPWRVRQGVLLLILGFALLLIYSAGGYYLLQEHFVTTGTTGSVVRSLLKRTINQPSSELLPLTRRASWFLQSIPWLSATVLLTGIAALLRPVSARWWLKYQGEQLAYSRQKAAELVYRFGSETLSFFALAPENLRYIAPNSEGVVSYRLSGNIAVILGDPICVPGAFERVLQSFLDFCSRQDWQVAIFQAHPEYLPIYRKLGLRVFKIGEEAMIDPRTFTLSGSAMANVRTTCRRAERAEVSVRWYDGIPPQDIRDQLQHLSQQWLERKAGKNATEMGFSMGRFDELVEAASWAEMIANNHAQQKDIPCLVTGVAFTYEEKACAFVTFTPIYGMENQQPGKGWALDLMRRAADAPPGVIELLLTRGIEYFRTRGATVISLGVVAMADTQQEMTPSQRQLASFVSEHLRLLETHRSLFFFKQKFHPRWESRYIVASNILALPKIALAVLRVHQS